MALGGARSVPDRKSEQSGRQVILPDVEQGRGSTPKLSNRDWRQGNIPYLPCHQPGDASALSLLSALRYKIQR